jgi:hypothetical protein
MYTLQSFQHEAQLPPRIGVAVQEGPSRYLYSLNEATLLIHFSFLRTRGVQAGDEVDYKYCHAFENKLQLYREEL